MVELEIVYESEASQAFESLHLRHKIPELCSGIFLLYLLLKIKSLILLKNRVIVKKNKIYIQKRGDFFNGICNT